MDYDLLLKRDLLPGKEFDKLFPPSTCQVQYLGEGLTDHTIEQMEAWVLENAHEAEKVAKKLQQSSLIETCKKIHWFEFNHFQYKADQADQYLRAPGCAWHSRHEGMDCKSYSVLASCLLLNMGITHYIRKIKQLGDNPEDFTHVYVVVPKNQKTGNLNEGYITIDGTLPTMAEPHFIDKSDLIMSLQHYGLKGANPGLGFSFSDIGNLFSNINCIGGSGFTEGAFNEGIANLEKFYKDLVNSLNSHVGANNMTELALDVQEFHGISKILVAGFEKKLSEGWNTCTSKRLRAQIDFAKFMRDNVGKALDAYLDKYFIRTNTGSSSTFVNTHLEAPPTNFRFIYTGSPATVTQVLQTLSVRPGTTEIPRFEMTPYLVSTVGTTNLNVSQFLSGLTTVIASFSPTPTGGSPSVGTGTYTPTTPGGTNNQDVPTTQTAGGGILMWVIGLGVLGYAFTQMNDNGKGAKKE